MEGDVCITLQWNIEMISLRTGCFCNPGIDELNNCISADQLREYFTSRISGDQNDMVSFMRITRGAIRLSVGCPTSYADIEKFICFAGKFLNKTINSHRIPCMS